MSKSVEEANCVLECSADELGGSSRDHGRLLTSLKAGRNSKIDDNDAANHEQVSYQRTSSPLVLQVITAPHD